MLKNNSCRDDATNTDQTSSTHFASLPRWWWIAMMAACLIGLCTKGFAGDPVVTTSAIQLDAILPGPIQALPATSDSVSPRTGRPTMVDFSAHLANFDRDADTDGWLATIVLRDASGQHASGQHASGQMVTARAYATFELKVGRFAVDEVTFVAGEHVVHRWSKSLMFDDDGVARVRLEQRGATKSKHELTMDRSTSLVTQPMYNMGSRFPIQRLSYADRFRYTPTNGLIGPDTPFTPVFGALQVRVSVPTQGTFDGVSIVRLNSPVINAK